MSKLPSPKLAAFPLPHMGALFQEGGTRLLPQRLSLGGHAPQQRRLLQQGLVVGREHLQLLRERRLRRPGALQLSARGCKLHGGEGEGRSVLHDLHLLLQRPRAMRPATMDVEHCMRCLHACPGGPEAFPVTDPPGESLWALRAQTCWRSAPASTPAASARSLAATASLAGPARRSVSSSSASTSASSSATCFCALRSNMCTRRFSHRRARRA